MANQQVAQLCRPVLTSALTPPCEQSSGHATLLITLFTFIIRLTSPAVEMVPAAAFCRIRTSEVFVGPPSGCFYTF